MDTIVGNESQYALLSGAFSRGMLHHGYLFSGPEGVGKKTLAIALARYMACRGDKKNNVACARCISCAFSIEQHPDIYMVGVAQEDVSMDVIRMLKRRLRFGSVLGGVRVVIIDNAHNLSRESANALLKLIEEPSENIYFFLISHHFSQMPKTVISRLHVVRFFSAPADTVYKYFTKKIPKETVEFAYAIAGGRIGFLQSYFTWFEEKNISVLRDLAHVIMGEKLFLWSHWQSYVEQEESSYISFNNLIEGVLHMLIRIVHGLTRDDQEFFTIKNIRRDFLRTQYLANIMHIIEITQSTNANGRLAWEQLFWTHGNT